MAVDPTLAFRDFQLLKLKHYEPLSNFAFNCNLRHYSKESNEHLAALQQEKARLENAVAHLERSNEELIAALSVDGEDKAWALGIINTSPLSQLDAAELKQSWSFLSWNHLKPQP